MLLNEEFENLCNDTVVVNRMRKVLKFLRRANDDEDFDQEIEECMASFHIWKQNSNNRLAQQRSLDTYLERVQRDIILSTNQERIT